MEASQISIFLKQPNLLNESTLVDLKHIVERFPYFHAAWLLYLRNLKECEDPAFHIEKSRAAAFIPNRGKLLQFINYQPTIQVKTEFFKSTQSIEDTMFKHTAPTSPEKQANQQETTKDAQSPANIKDRISDVLTKVSPSPIPEMEVISAENEKNLKLDSTAADLILPIQTKDTEPAQIYAHADKQVAEAQNAADVQLEPINLVDQNIHTDFDNDDCLVAEDIHYHARNEYLDVYKLENTLTESESLEDIAIAETDINNSLSSTEKATETTEAPQKIKKTPKDFRDFDNEHEAHEPEDIHHGLRNEFLEINNLKQEYKAPHTFRDFDNGHEFDEVADIHHSARNLYLEENKLEDLLTEPESLEDIAVEEENMEATDIHYNWRNEYLETNILEVEEEIKEENPSSSLLILEEESNTPAPQTTTQLDAADSLLARIQALKKNKEANTEPVKPTEDANTNIIAEENTLAPKDEELIVLDSEEVQAKAEVIAETPKVIEDTPINSEADLTNSIMEKIALIKAKKQQAQETGASETASDETGIEVREEKPKRDLIDQFIASGSRIARRIPMDSALAREPQEDISVHSIKESDDFITEGLAKVFTKQGYHQKAIDAYEKLILKYPEKSSYFAEQIENVKELINKQKK